MPRIGCCFHHQSMNQSTLENKSKNENENFRNQLERVASAGYTINMEWTSPKNQIVIPYMATNLNVLNIRSHETGGYVHMEDLKSYYFDEITTDYSILIPMKSSIDGLIRLRSTSTTTTLISSGLGHHGLKKLTTN
jgi:hypothetical protein